MAEDILNQVHASDLFDLRGVVAVVTGGGTVSLYAHFISQFCSEMLPRCSRALD